MKRRDLLKILGITSAAGAATRAGAQSLFPYIDHLGRIYPYVNEFEQALPGEPTYYSTTCRECPAGCGMVVKVRDGRATKAEGNPRNPLNQGALCPLGQASMQGLYHPKRIRHPYSQTSKTITSMSWDDALKKVSDYLSALADKDRAANVAFVTGAIGPTTAKVIDAFLESMGAPPRISYEPLGMEGWRAANLACFGKAEVPDLMIDKSEFLVSFASEFVEDSLFRVEYMRRLADARAKWGAGKNRFYHLGGRMSLTAGNADEWIPIRPGSEGLVAMAMVRAILDNGWMPAGALGPVEAYRAATRSVSVDMAAKASGMHPDGIVMIAKRLATERPSLCIGPNIANASREVNIAVNMLNAITGAVNNTVRFGSGAGAGWSSYSDVVALADRIEAGEVDALFTLGIDLMALPVGARLAEPIKKTGLRVSFANLGDKTSEVATMVLPSHHFLETWDDYTPRQGLEGLVQPTRQPLLDTMHPADVLISVSNLLGKNPNPNPAARYYDVLEKAWQSKDLSSVAGPGKPWFDVRQQGGMFADYQPVSVALNPAAASGVFEKIKEVPKGLVLLPAAVSLQYDGRGQYMPWLQEVPDPITKISWGSWIEMHPSLAEKVGVKQGDVVKVITADGTCEWPVKLSNWSQLEVATVPTGPDPDVAGLPSGSLMHVLPAKASSGGGIDWLQSIKLEHTVKWSIVATLQMEENQQKRGIIQDVDYVSPHNKRDEWKEEYTRQKPPRENMYEGFDWPLPGRGQHKWGMVVDLDRCVGCNACAVACYAENNLPVVGRDRIIQRRELAWLRVERFLEEKRGRLEASFGPILCQHCDNAPCESVCPVFAAYHTPEGINGQVYNRCIGTRFCANNCPYKVRRFNWFSYKWEEPLNLQLNPEVTTREMGVMEKCSFCIQRIVHGKHKAKLEGRKLEDGEIVPACAQTCPAKAIVFGDLADPNSRVSQLSLNGRGYKILEQLNTRPAVTYLKRIRRK